MFARDGGFYGKFEIRKIQSLIPMAASISKRLIQSALMGDSTRACNLLLHLFWLPRELKIQNC